MLSHRVICPNDVNGMTNIEYGDETAPLEAVRSGSALFARSYLPEKNRIIIMVEE